MKDVIARCKDSPSIVTIRKETSLPSVSSRLVNLQTAGTNLVSLGEGRKKGSVRGRKRKLIRSDSSGATEFSLKQTLSGLQSLYAEYKTALEGRKVTTGASLTRKGTEKKRAAEKREGGTEREVKERSPAVVLRRKERSDRQLQSGDIPIELKRKSWSFQRREGIQLTSRWENRDSNKKSTVESRSAARQTVKSEKLNRGGSSEEGSSFKRSYTLPGHFRGWRAPGLSVLEKAAAFSKVTEGTGLSAPYGLHKASATKTRRPSLDGRELDSRKSESQPKTATSDNVAGSSSTEKSVGKPPAVQTAVVKTVISTQESVKRVSLIDVDVSKPQPTADSESRGPPLTRVVSPSTQVLPLEQEAPPRVVSPEPHKPKTTATPVTLSTTTTTTSSSKSLATVTKNSRRSIQNLKIAGKVSHLKHVFDRQEEEVAESAGKPPSTTTSPRTREMEGRLSPDIVPKVSESAEIAVSDAGLTMADRPIPSPDITPKETSFPVRVPLPQPAEAETIEPLEERATVKSEVEVRVEAIVEKSPVKEEEARATVGSLSPHHPELPQTSSPEVKTPPPRPPSPIGYILEDSSDGESSYQSYDTEYSDEEEEDEEEEEEEEEEEGEMEDVDSGTISRRTAKTLQAVTQALMSQELSYLQSLEILAETYLPSLTKTHVPSFLQGRGLKIFANVADLYEVHRTFYAEVSSGKLDTPLAIVESFCQALVRNQDSWNQYQTFLLNMEQGQRVLSQYGGTFFQEVQASIGDNHTLEEHFVRPRDQLMRYDRILKDVVMCAQKEYLHGVGIAKDALRVIQNILHATNNAIAMGKLRGCPISLDKTGLLMTEEFNMYTTREEKKKVVREWSFSSTGEHVPRLCRRSQAGV
ncbi:Pleckstrin homology domain-containing family G member 4B [Geodia barretti]|nr:Pleckstrin homology domain-containing family G member 4B [Geodia barretti]